MFKDTQQHLQRLDAALQQEAREEMSGISAQPAKPVRLRNTDAVDVDMDDYSTRVLEREKSTIPLVITAALLTTGIVALAIWWLIRLGGLL